MRVGEALEVVVGADTSEADRKLNDLGDRGGGARWAGNLAKVGVGAFAAVGSAATAVVGMGLKVAADMEQADIAFSTMLGSGEKAKAFLEDLKAFAAKTPFEFPQLQQAASSLVSAGFEANKVIPIMTTLGDVTSGMGTGAEGVQRATVALQQMSAAGRITGEDLNQLRDAGIPVFDLLSAATGKTKEEIAALAQAGKLGKAEMNALFKALETGKGLERFNGLMEKQSQSLTGLLSSLKDNVQQSLGDMMGPVVANLKRQLPRITGIIGDALEKVGPQLGGLASGLIDALSNVLPHVVPVLGAVATAAGQVFSTLAPAVGQLLPSFVRIITALLPILPSMARLLVALAPPLTMLAELLAAVIEAIPIPVLTAVAIAIGAWASPIFAVVAAAALLAAGVKLVMDNWDVISGFFTGLWDRVTGIFTGATNIIKTLIGNWPRVLLAVMTGGWSEIIAFVIRNWDGIKGAVTRGIAGVVGFVAELPGKILRALASLGPDLLNLGEWAFNSLKRGIASIVPKIMDIASDLVKRLIKKLDPRNWFSTPEEHYRPLWAAAFGAIGEEAKRSLRGTERQVGRLVDVTGGAGLGLGLSPTVADVRGSISPPALTPATPVSGGNVIIVEGSLVTMREVYEELRTMGIELAEVGSTRAMTGG